MTSDSISIQAISLAITMAIIFVTVAVLWIIDDVRQWRRDRKLRQLESIKRSIKAEEFARLGLTDADLAQSRADFEAILKEEGVVK